MSTRIGETEQPLLARIEKTETAFLTEFHKWASPVEMRQRTRAAVQRVTEVETEALTGRVKKLETSWVVVLPAINLRSHNCRERANADPPAASTIHGHNWRRFPTPFHIVAPYNLFG